MTEDIYVSTLEPIFVTMIKFSLIAVMRADG